MIPTRAVIRAVRAQPSARDRLHVAARAVSCPWPEVLDAMPPGLVLDVGCGHGLLAHLSVMAHPGTRVVGIDVDHRKIDAATAATRRLGLARRAEFALSGTSLPQGPFDTVVIADVLYLLDEPTAFRLLDSARGVLASDGALIIKEMALDPRWKARWNERQEHAATQVLRYTVGEVAGVHDPERIRDHLEALGLEVRQRRIDRRYPHPHHLTIARPANWLSDSRS